MSRVRLLNPGPVTLSERVRRALLCPDLCHREPAFAALMREVRDGLARVYPGTEAEFSTVLFTGSGTAAVEAMVGSLVPRDGTALVICNGVYGERMGAMVEAHGKRLVTVPHAWTDAVRLDAVERALRDDPSITHVLVVHHETTTGRLNDLRALAAVCRDRGVAMLVDGVSSFGGEPMDLVGWPIDAVAATANKCLHGVPGVSFVLVRTAALRRGSASPSLYLDLHRNHAAQEDDTPLFTPAVQVLAALREALAELHEDGGWQARHARYRALSQRLRQSMAELGLRQLLHDPEHAGCTLTAFELPDGHRFDDLYAALRARDFVIYPGQRTLFERIFRLAVMGDLTRSDIDELGAALADILAGGGGAGSPVALRTAAGSPGGSGMPVG